MAATANMARQHNTKQYNGVAPDTFGDGLVDHDMHLKMSKKIAQLTKVIYALNTKNDEHDNIIKSIQLQHDKDKTQLLDETKHRIDSLKSKILQEAELQTKIKSLESCIEEHALQKKRILHEFDRYKGETADQEFRLHAQYEGETQKLQTEISQIRGEFQEKLMTFQNIINSFEADKIETMNDLKNEHQLEMEKLMSSQKHQSSNIAAELDILKAQYAAEMLKQQEAYDFLKQEKHAVEEDYEAKLKKLKDFYEKEFAATQSSQNNSALEAQKLLHEKIEKLTRDFQFQEKQYRQRIESLLSDLATAEETIADLKSQLENISSNFSSSSDELSSLKTQLSNMKKAFNETSDLYKDSQRELQVLRERYEQQANELVKKSGTIGELTAAKADRDSKIRQLEDELSDIKSKLKRLQDEKDSILNKTTSDVNQKSQEVQALERALEDSRIEKQAQRDKYEGELSSLEKRLTIELENAEKTTRDEISILVTSHEKALESLRLEEEKKRAQIHEEWRMKFEQEVNRLELLNRELNEKYHSEVGELKQKLHNAEQQIANLMKRIGDTADGLGAATSELTQLRDQAASLRQQLDKANIELQSSNSQVNTLKIEVESLKSDKKDLSLKHAEELEEKLKQLHTSLEQTWIEKLRSECEKLRLELERQYSNDRDSSIRHLQSQRDAEIEKIKFESHAKIIQLQRQVDELERALNQVKNNNDDQFEQMKQKYEQQITDLMSEIDRVAAEYEKKMKSIGETMEVEWKEKVRIVERSSEEALLDLKNRHIQDMTAQVSAHRSAVDMIKREAEHVRLNELEKQESLLKQQADTMQQELVIKHQREVETYNQNFAKQLTAARMELQRAVELKNQKERELNDTKEDLTKKISSKDWTIRSLEGDIQKLDEEIKKLNREIEVKGEEVLQTRSEASRQLRRREEAMAREHADDIERLQAQHAEDTQQILAEFSKAQEILKEKITELSEMLEEAEERYRNREPREEDLNMIEQLRIALKAREQEMEQLIAEKQYFQMELVNRETNFTKVFAGSSKHAPNQPQVGFINPLAKKKKGEKGPTRFTVGASGMDGMVSNSSSAGSHKLRPIAGSPIHDSPINPNHVLPTPQAFTKKFVQ